MSKQRDELLDHDYDGIKEYDNPLPQWWLWLFVGTIVFAMFYLPWHWMGFGLTGPEEYQQEVATAEKQIIAQQQAASQPAASKPGTPGQKSTGGEAQPAAAAATDPKTIEAGKAIFAANCVPCHGPQGQGIIGPNLTDNYWLHGNTLADVTRTITNGVPDKGMIAWKAVLNPEKIVQVAVYVNTLKGTNPPNPKAPQGDLYKD